MGKYGPKTYLVRTCFTLLPARVDQMWPPHSGIIQSISKSCWLTSKRFPDFVSPFLWLLLLFKLSPSLAWLLQLPSNWSPWLQFQPLQAIIHIAASYLKTYNMLFLFRILQGLPITLKIEHKFPALAHPLYTSSYSTGLFTDYTPAKLAL